VVVTPGTRCETFPVFFWVTVVGGLLLAVSVFYDPRGITAIVGLVLFVLGAALVFSRSLAESRREGTGLVHAIVLSVRKALRFAWALMP
jgi:membrane-bound ClpP family serine protease